MDRKFPSRLTGELESDSMTATVNELKMKHPLSGRLGGLSSKNLEIKKVEKE